jgi:hypothetical protein
MLKLKPRGDLNQECVANPWHMGREVETGVIGKPCLPRQSNIAAGVLYLAVPRKYLRTKLRDYT